jgi:hypothetical protein
MPFHAACTRRRLATLTTGDHGTALLAGADATLRAQGAADPGRLAAVFAP